MIVGIAFKMGPFWSFRWRICGGSRRNAPAEARRRSLEWICGLDDEAGGGERPWKVSGSGDGCAVGGDDIVAFRDRDSRCPADCSIGSAAEETGEQI